MIQQGVHGLMRCSWIESDVHDPTVCSQTDELFVDLMDVHDSIGCSWADEMFMDQMAVHHLTGCSWTDGMFLDCIHGLAGHTCAGWLLMI